MRVLVAPDKFAGTLTAVEAAEAIADGWRRQAPDDELDLAPMADGGPGFVDVLHEALGGELLAVTVAGPFGEPTPATVLRGRRDGVRRERPGLRPAPDPPRARRGGLDARRRRAGAGGGRRRGPGGGGRARRQRHHRRGRRAARRPRRHGRPPARRRAGRPRTASPPSTSRRAGPASAGVALVAASDVDNPLTGLFGAAKTFGPQKGIAEDRIPVVDGWLEAYAAAVDRRTSLLPGAGAAGGLGFALLALGASRRPGFDVVAEATRLAERARAADLVLTGEGAFDFSSRAGKVPYGVATVAAEALRPCVALAGKVLVGSREMRALGVESAYAIVDLVGEERAFAEPAAALADLAERVARTLVALTRVRSPIGMPRNNRGVWDD